MDHDAAAPISAWLFLNMGLESEYWKDPVTIGQLYRADSLGLMVGTTLNGYIGIVAAKENIHRFYILMTAFLQLAQLVWMLAAPRSYHQRRVPVTWLQRIRWLFLFVANFGIKNVSHAEVTSFLEQHARGAPETWQAFFGIAFHLPYCSMSSALIHFLPFKQQFLAGIITAAMYLMLGLPKQITALVLYKLDTVAKQVCELLEISMTVPLPDLNEGGIKLLCGGRRGSSIVLSTVFFVVGLGIPMQVVYWQERASKRAFLYRRGICVGMNEPITPFVFSWVLFAAMWIFLTCWHFWEPPAAGGE